MLIGLAENIAVVGHDGFVGQKFEKENQFPAVRLGSDSLSKRDGLKQTWRV